MPVPKPSHLVVPERYLPPSGKVSHGEKITLRCDSGQVLDIPSTANASTVRIRPSIKDVRKFFGILDPILPVTVYLSILFSAFWLPPCADECESILKSHP